MAAYLYFSQLHGRQRCSPTPEGVRTRAQCCHRLGRDPAAPDAPMSSSTRSRWPSSPRMILSDGSPGSGLGTWGAQRWPPIPPNLSGRPVESLHPSIPFTFLDYHPLWQSTFEDWRAGGPSRTAARLRFRAAGTRP